MVLRLHGWTRWVACPECKVKGFTQVIGLNHRRPVVASNVIIKYTQEFWLPPLKTGWININTTGGGKALMLWGSQVVQGTWTGGSAGRPSQSLSASRPWL